MVKKFILLLVSLFIVSAGASFATGSSIRASDGLAVVEKLDYYLDTSELANPRDIGAVMVNADTHGKVVTEDGVHVLLGAYVQHHGKTNDGSRTIIRYVHRMAELGYKPVNDIIRVAEELLREKRRR
jgi:hypothetical protein